MLEKINASLDLIIQQTQANYPILLRMLLLLWGIFLFNKLLGGRLFIFGIFPRRLWSLPTIFTAPFLHVDFNHLFFNCIPLVVLSNFILINGWDYFIHVTLAIIAISGALTWLLGKDGIHLGASGVITGYWGLLISDIFQQANVTAYILGAISLYYFAGIFLGIFPSRRGVSWEGHLFGLCAGVIVSMW